MTFNKFWNADNGEICSTYLNSTFYNSQSNLGACKIINLLSLQTCPLGGGGSNTVS